ncbi:MAG: serine acetyltransferase, partial [Desulfobacterales bacterium]
MGLPKEHREATCKMDAATDSRLRDRLPSIAEKIIENCTDTGCFTHVDFEPIPSKQSVIEIIEKLREVIFPGYFNREKLDPVNLKYYMGQTVSVLFDLISEQVTLSIRHDCFRYDKPCSECRDRGHDVALALLEEIPGIREILATDIQAAYDGDPAARSTDEIIFSYPGIFAITTYRVAHKLHEFGVPLLPRIMTEYAHNLTGIDIH